MNLRELARKDLERTVEGKQAGSTTCTLYAPGGEVWVIPMLLSDIGYSLDTDGNSVAGRTCWGSYVSDRVCDMEGRTLVPCEGWKVSWLDLDGTVQRGSVSYSQPDKTINLTKMFFTMDLDDE